jgi:fructosamine-3-kinase
MVKKNLKSIVEEILQEPVTQEITGSGIIETLSGKSFFIKTGEVSRTYQCEANGLNELAKAKAIRIANVIHADKNFILTGFIRKGYVPSDFFESFGKKFARMHRYQSMYFGFFEDNFIGATPQLNIPEKEEKTNWTAFYFNKRLLFQFKLAEKNRLASPTLRNGFLKLESKIEFILKDGKEPPCLLHGDLWSGNYLCDNNGDPVLIDPAVYYGHREADLAMTRLFGGFSTSFYQGYMDEYPLQEDWEYREDIYKLYHVLNHLNIFGPGYLSEAEYLLKKYV